MLCICTGADLNHKDLRDETALIYAAQNERLTAVKILLAEGE